MDASLLTSREFWDDQAPAVAGEPALAGHVLFETSGSSGTPKQVALSKVALLASAGAVNRHLNVSTASCWGLALPLHHVGGFGVAARAFEAGCRFERFGGRWNAKAFGEWLQSSAVTHTSLVPTQVHDLAKANLRAPRSLAAIVVGGGHLDTATGQQARNLGWPVLASYGMTEAGSQIATQSLEELGFPYQSSPIPLLPIWDAKTSADGLLSISGPALFSGYVMGGRFLPREAEWHMTSDRAALTNRMLVPLGRVDTLVKILGELVDPEAIERELVAISQGAIQPGTFAIMAVPDERAGHVLVPVFESSINPQLIESTLSSYDNEGRGLLRLRSPVVVDVLPRNELGKIQRSLLVAVIRN